MERKDFVARLAAYGACPALLAAQVAPADEAAAVRADKEFIQNWLADLLAAMERQLDRATCEKLLAGCGRGCYDRHAFKREIAARGRGDLKKLIAAYSQNFEIWQAADGVHVRYGETSPRCYCPAARYRPARPNDLHCECTRATHQAIFEEALGRPVPVAVLESLRRGGRTCHFLARV